MAIEAGEKLKKSGMQKNRNTLVGMYCILTFGIATSVLAQPRPIGTGWSQNSVNATIFRKNSVVTHHTNQYVAYYDAYGNVVLAKRKLGDDRWETRQTQFKGDVTDAHRSISIMVDGDGYLHMAWNQHSDPLNYVKSIAPETLAFGERSPMLGMGENSVSYPEFFRLPNGDLLFLYRDGSSGKGNLVLNRYHLDSKKWTRTQDVILDGEGKRNAYWQSYLDAQGTFHISWVWRETPNVETNHDMCYAKSADYGATWQKSTGAAYSLPINAENAEYVVQIPQGSELINSTSMYADTKGNLYIATYFTPKESNIPQYHLIYKSDAIWKVVQITERRTPFTLSGGGTKKIPISRPQIVVDDSVNPLKIYMIYRDVEYDSRAIVAANKEGGFEKWDVFDLTDFSVGSWEPSYDSELWRTTRMLHVFVQKVGQGDGETLESVKPQPVYIYEVPFINRQ